MKFQNRQIHIDRKQMSGSLGLRRGENWKKPAKGSFGSASVQFSSFQWLSRV